MILSVFFTGEFSTLNKNSWLVRRNNPIYPETYNVRNDEMEGIYV